MLGKNRLGYRYHLLIPAFITGLVAANQQQCFPFRVERVEDAVRLSSVLHPQLFQIAYCRTFQRVGMGTAKLWAVFL